MSQPTYRSKQEIRDMLIPGMKQTSYSIEKHQLIIYNKTTVWQQNSYQSKAVRRLNSVKERENRMIITMNQEGTKLTVALEGRLDTTTSPQLETQLNPALNGVTDLVFDLEKLVYISSAGLRVLLSAQKVMNRQGKMTIRKACQDIMDIFDVTGFVDILNIEN